MGIKQNSYEIVEKRRLSSDVHDIVVYAPEVAGCAVSGQFAHIKCGEFTLRRPISICELDKTRGTVRFVVQERGKGTQALGAMRKGNLLDMIAPLGNGFELLSPDKRALFVGGGIGVPPLLEAAKRYGKNAGVLLGFRSADAVILKEDFERYGCGVQIATDDGSAGYHGYAPQLLEKMLQSSGADIIYSCGPMSMQRAVAQLAQSFGVRCQLSLEERMGCGVGGCLVCVCKTSSGGKTEYSRVCREGPVFEAQEVEFDG